MVRQEDKMLSMAVNGKGLFLPLHPQYKIRQDFLNQDQRKAIETLLTSNDFVTLIQGYAGTGKTSLLTELLNATKEARKSLLAVASSSQATKELAKHKFDAHTIAMLIQNKKLQERLRGGVLLIDEGSLVSTRTLNQLFEIAKEQKARLCIAGDHLQHQSVEAGSAFRQLQQKAKCKTAYVKTILRQKPEDYRHAVELLASNRTLEGYQVLDQKMKAVKEIEDNDERIHQMADDFIASKMRKRSSLVISPTNAEGALINGVIRQKLRKKDVIKGKDHEIQTLRNLNLTEAQRKNISSYEENQVVKFVKAQAGGYRAGDHFRVLPIRKSDEIHIQHTRTGQIKKLPYQHSRHFQVFQTVPEKLAIGDEIRFTANVHPKGEKGRILNGTTHRITSITRQAIKLSNGKTLDRDIGHIRPAYTETSYSAQGKSVQDVFISMSDLSFAGASKEQIYVSVSRGIRNVRIYTNAKADLKRAIQKGGQRITATEIAEDPRNKQVLQRQQHHRKTLIEKVKEMNSEKQKYSPGKKQDANVYKEPKYNVYGK